MCQVGNNYDYGILKFLRALRDVPTIGAFYVLCRRAVTECQWALLTNKKKGLMLVKFEQLAALSEAKSFSFEGNRYYAVSPAAFVG